MEQDDNYQFFFTYGQKVKIQYHQKTTDCIMCLSADNNFFLKFVQQKDSLKIIKIVFIPHIKNVRKKLQEKTIKIRMEDPKESFYIKNDSIKKLNIFASNFSKLIEHVRKFKYSRYSWNNLMHYTLFELKIHKDKDQVFTQKDLKIILEKIQIFNKKQKQALEQLQKQSENDKLNSHDTKFSQNFNIRRSETLNDSQVFTEPNFFLDKVRKRLKEVIENQEKNLKPREVYKIFYTIVQRNELKPLFDCCRQQKESWDDLSVIEEQIQMTKTMIRKSSFNNIPTITKIQKNLPLKSFIKFLKHVQEENLEEKNLQKIYQFFQDIRQRNLFKKKSFKQIKSITFEEFCMFMFSKKNSILDPQKTYVYQDENYPLSCYFINSSHNTYLVGKQFYGKSGIEGYQRAIEEGYKSVEIDIWNGKDGQPIVTHGRTFTKEYPLEQVVQFLSKIAFQKSSYPLILSLEMHCDKEQRVQVAEIFQYYFENKLFILTEQLLNSKQTLADLKNKVILKTNSPYFDELNLKDRELNPKNQEFLNDPLSKITSMFKEVFSQEEYKSQNPKMKKFLTKFGVSSFSNGKIQKMLNDQNNNKMIDFTKDYFIRVYPGISHIFSANYDPIDFWIAGIQMVCLNIQYLDENILINRQLFRKNGGRKGGYILKPQYMLKDIFKIHKLTMNQYFIDVISSQIINKSLITQGDYLEISFKGTHLDQNLNTRKYIYDFVCNFVHPILVRKGQERVQFKLCYPDFGFFLFKIKNSKGYVQFQGCINVDLIRPGYRVLRIFDKNLFHNDQSYLFVRITKKQLNYKIFIFKIPFKIQNFLISFYQLNQIFYNLLKDELRKFKQKK